jgi:hypothetical protein
MLLLDVQPPLGQRRFHHLADEAVHVHAAFAGALLGILKEFLVDGESDGGLTHGHSPHCNIADSDVNPYGEFPRGAGVGYFELWS